VQQAILNSWHPSHPDLVADAFPMWNYETYCKLPLEQKKLGLLIYAPVTSSKNPERGFKMNAVYVVAKGMGKILKKYEQNPDSESAKLFFEDFYKLNLTLQKYGYVGFPGTALGYNKEFSEDFIFEASDYFKSVLSATRENFEVFGTKRYAVLEFSDTEQRILTENKIDSKIHEDLLRWRDDYRAAQLKAKGSYKFDIPKPTRSPLLSNLALSTLKYFRGDERKILHWGLDLSGGKTVQIELKDNNNRTVTKEADIKQGINELYKRVNKMGVSEVSIRQEGHHITLDFPGSQNLTAADLVKASSMFFNVINEQFSTSNKLLSDSVNRFLQDVWNEAVVTNKKSVDEINFIAWRHLYGDALSSETAQPRTDAAKFLHENGLQLSNPQEPMTSSAFDTQFSKIALLRGEDYTHWQGQTHPLMIVFSNYALEGSNIDDVRASYDPSKGNFLSFSVKNSSSSRSADSYNPRDQFFNWTSSFSKESPSTNSSLALNRGWRMAVILNGSIVSAPTLDSALRESAMISGSFSQREVNQLEADLKAGSLTFTPKILSEKNVSPELGKQERYLGIFATIIALILVIATMVGYYRFGGLVASVAVVFNLLIMWATLQNIQATLTLPMIAGLILTVGMAVDANVLVFERIREEFSISGRIASAIHAGYKKAFSAILDSNVTTVIAGLVLLQFDSGPIKGFALTLIIGIASSMFTALFMTKFFFARWIENPANKKLTMMNLFKAKKFDFLKWTKTALIASAIFILAGIACFVSQKQTIMGMDFTGGYALNLEINSGSEVDYRNIVENALIKEGVLSQDFQIRELNPSNHIRLFLSNTLENAGKAFYGMAPSQSIINAAYPGENPRINWIVSALEKNGVMLDPTSLNHLDSNWAEISGQMSETMRDNAIIGLAIALVGILLYITIRFEFKYAISATLCLAHDIVFTIGAIAMLHALGVSVQIDLNIIAALMTIVGYSLNDTIIVFDRIREDVRLMKNTSFSEIINHSLNVTLSRTLMTSGTTLLVLVPLVLLGGSTILGFSLVMAIGVIFGTLSSLFIAAPLMLYFHRRETDKNKNNAIKTV
ncbi:MAG: protein translocase subunit SecD, partial [Chlamydiae bacterium]|nr:protein translocase subunit SecD [Chlamydiota bacterium]